MNLVLAVVLIASTIGQIAADFGCKNELGKDVDWYVLYKLPKNSKSANRFEKVGEAYSYLDVKKGSWVSSDKSVEDPKSSLAYTYNQVIKNRQTLAYLIYNDQPPNEAKNSAYYGHTKGFLATDGKKGFWLVHSIPRFPAPPDNGTYDYPENGKDNGQSVICISFLINQLPAIVNLFRYSRPKIYSRNSIKAIESLPDELLKFFKGKPKYVKAAPFNTTFSLTSRGGQSFTVFGKHTKWGKDVYDGLVAPSLMSSLYVQSWQVGAGTRLAADCHDFYKVYNVEAMTLNYIPGSPTSFSSNNDHSKWATTQSSNSPWACLGDINRMESQFKRGGGVICLKSPSTWRAYSSIITATEGCPTGK